MEYDIIQTEKGKNIALVTTVNTISTSQDALDLLMNCMYNGADGLVLNENFLHPDFFELKSGIAGNVLQVFSTYNGYLAIVGQFDRHNSKSLSDFIYESNKQGRIGFVESQTAAIEFLNQNIR
ncbi:MAG TPA: DUF4180 domain-containing protein [Bacteroidia bacterium]